MKFAILAAGEGSRLSQEGVETPKPLVKVNGEAMIDRLIRIFNNCEAESIYIITNNLTPLTQQISGTCKRWIPKYISLSKRLHLLCTVSTNLGR